jgi:adenylate kinase
MPTIRRVVLLGPPGSGKGTQAPRLAVHLGAPLVSVGDVLRAEVERATELGVRVAEVMARGDLVPDELVSDVVLARLGGVGDYVLDGFPRTVAQAERLWASPARPTLAVELVVSPEVIAHRLRERGRTDDTPATLARRLAVYREQTEPVVLWLAMRALVECVEAERSPIEVASAIVSVVRRRFAPAPRVAEASPLTLMGG